MSEKRYSLEYAEAAAKEIVELLAPAVVRIEIAGSIRRRKPDVKDIEIVCTPRLEDDPSQLFATQQHSILDARILKLHNEKSALAFPDMDRKNGERYKRLQWQRAIGVDLFVVLPPAQWGPILTIRTGPADFSHRLVTSRSLGGAMPAGIRQDKGRLVQADFALDTPEETDFFAALGLPWIPPEERSVESLERALRDPRRPAGLHTCAEPAASSP